MVQKELFELLNYVGEDMSELLLERDNKSLQYIAEAMHGSLSEYLFKDPQGLTQLGSMLGHPRAVNVLWVLSTVGFDAKLFNKNKFKRCDVLLEGLESECRGSIAHCSKKKYGIPRGGKYNLKHDKRIYFLIREKIDLDICKLTSLLFQILYIDSSKFEKTNSDRVNITQMKKICPEDIIGEWEVFNK